MKLKIYLIMADYTHGQTCIMDAYLDKEQAESMLEYWKGQKGIAFAYVREQAVY